MSKYAAIYHRYPRATTGVAAIVWVITEVITVVLLGRHFEAKYVFDWLFIAAIGAWFSALVAVIVRDMIAALLQHFENRVTEIASQQRRD